MPLSMVPFTPSETLPFVLGLLSVRTASFFTWLYRLLIISTINNIFRDTGPALSGTLVQTIGFEWMLFGIAIISFMYAPLLYYLRNPPTKEERQVINRLF